MIKSISNILILLVLLSCEQESIRTKIEPTCVNLREPIVSRDTGFFVWHPGSLENGFAEAIKINKEWKASASANVSETDGLAARASFTDSTSNWESARYLWRKIEMEEEVLGAISPVDSFYLATQEQAIGQLQAVESYIAAAAKIDTIVVEGWDTDFDAIEDWLSQISALEVDYQNATSNAQRDDIIQQRQTLTNQIAQTVTDNVQERETILAANRDNLNFAYQLNEQIIPSNSFAANEQFINCLAILSLYDQDFELEEIDRIELLGIANECPNMVGSIVFRARSLYEVLTEEEMDFDCE